MRFGELWKKFFFNGHKRFFFFLYTVITTRFFLVLFWPNLSKEKIGIFCPKAWVNPFEKMRFFGLKNSVFKAKKGSFSLQSHKALFLVLFWSNRNQEGNCIFFWQKYGLTPLKKCVLLEFENFFFFFLG